MPNKEQPSTFIPERLLSVAILKINDFNLSHDLDRQIASIENKLESIEGSYAWHGYSPLNEVGCVAPKNPEVVQHHSQLSQEKYTLELTRFFSAVETIYSDSPTQNTEAAVRKMYWLTHRLGQFQPDVVRNNLGEQYVTWLEAATQTLSKLDFNSPQFNHFVHILETHLDVTDEFELLKIKFGNMLAAATLGLVDSTPSTTTAVAATSPYQAMN